MGWLAVAAIVAIALYPIFSNSGGKAVRKRLITGLFLSVLLVPNAYARDNSNASAAKPWVCDPTRPEGGKQETLGDALGGLLGAPTSNGRPVRREEPEMLTPEEQEARFACGRERLRLAQEKAARQSASNEALLGVYSAVQAGISQTYSNAAQRPGPSYQASALPRIDDPRPLIPGEQSETFPAMAASVEYSQNCAGRTFGVGSIHAAKCRQWASAAQAPMPQASVQMQNSAPGISSYYQQQPAQAAKPATVVPQQTTVARPTAPTTPRLAAPRFEDSYYWRSGTNGAADYVVRVRNTGTANLQCSVAINAQRYRTTSSYESYGSTENFTDRRTTFVYAGNSADVDWRGLIGQPGYNVNCTSAP